MTSQTMSVANVTNDDLWTFFGGAQNNNLQNICGAAFGIDAADADVAMRLKIVTTIPQGSTVNSATWRQVGYSTKSGTTFTARVKLEKTANAADMTDGANLDGRTYCSDKPALSNISVTQDANYDVDVTTAFQELVNFTALAANDYVLLTMEDQGSTGTDREFKSRDNGDHSKLLVDWSDPVVTYTAAAALTGGSSTLTATATYSSGTFTAASALVGTATTLAASATFTAPVYTAAATLAGEVSTLAASVSHTTPTYTATSALLSGVTALAATVAFTVPSYTAAASLDGSASLLSATMVHVTPIYSATADLSGAATTLVASAAHVTPTYTAAVALDSGSSTLAATATFAPLSFTAIGSLTGSASVLVAALTFTASLLIPGPFIAVAWANWQPGDVAGMNNQPGIVAAGWFFPGAVAGTNWQPGDVAGDSYQPGDKAGTNL